MDSKGCWDVVVEQSYKVQSTGLQIAVDSTLNSVKKLGIGIGLGVTTCQGGHCTQPIIAPASLLPVQYSGVVLSWFRRFPFFILVLGISHVTCFPLLLRVNCALYLQLTTTTKQH